MDIHIHLSKRFVLSTVVAFGVLVLVMGVQSYTSGHDSSNPPSWMGHSGEEVEVMFEGNMMNLNTALAAMQGSGTRDSEDFIFEVYNPDTTTYACVTQNLEEYCGDIDGCSIRLMLQHETQPNDQFLMIDEYIAMEQADLSNENGAGLYGHTRQPGGFTSSWITGTDARYTLYHPWDWTWMFNYTHGWCEGQAGHAPAFTDEYDFSFMSHPNVRTRIIVQD